MRHTQVFQFTKRSFQLTNEGEGGKMILPNKHITKHQLIFDLSGYIFLKYVFRNNN